MKRYSRATVWAVMEADDPICHAGLSEGNVSPFRKRDIIGEDGLTEPIPFISGNSIKHWLRKNSAAFALEALGFDTGDLDKSITRLLFAGGTLQSGKSSKFADARKAEEIFPALQLCGYAAGNQMSESTVRVRFGEVMCRENARRRQHIIEEISPDHLPHFEHPADHYIETQFEAPRDPHTSKSSGRWTNRKQREEVMDSMADRDSDDGDSRGFHKFDVLKSGTVIVAGFDFPQGVTEVELAAFRSAFAYGSLGRGIGGGLRMLLGGKTARGYGEVSTHLHGFLAEGIDPAHTYRDTEAFAVEDEFDESMETYVESLESAGKDSVYEALEGVVS